MGDIIYNTYDVINIACAMTYKNGVLSARVDVIIYGIQKDVNDNPICRTE